MIRMYHDDPSKTGGPTTADVPEEAVQWMRQAGWYQKESKSDSPEKGEEATVEQEAETPKRGRARK